MIPVAIEHTITNRRLGKGAARSHPKMLNFSDFVKDKIELPMATKFWRRKKAFPLDAFGNIDYGDCTRSKQAIAALRMERLEAKRTPHITDEEVIRVYFEMTERLYGGGDTGANEQDALDCWRREDQTFKDTKGHPLTIEAYTKVNEANQTELKKALWLAPSHCLPVCFNLPHAYSDGRTIWDVPPQQRLIGEWQPGSWGGHSCVATDYDEFGVTIPTWDIIVKVSWAAMAYYCDESYSIIDSIDRWRKSKITAKNIDLTELKAAVNKVSSVQI